MYVYVWKLIGQMSGFISAVSTAAPWTVWYNMNSVRCNAADSPAESTACNYHEKNEIE